MSSPLLHGAFFVSAIFLELISFDLSTFQVFSLPWIHSIHYRCTREKKIVVEAFGKKKRLSVVRSK